MKELWKFARNFVRKLIIACHSTPLAQATQRWIPALGIHGGAKQLSFPGSSRKAGPLMIESNRINDCGGERPC
jgi:hypothetical protein